MKTLDLANCNGTDLEKIKAEVRASFWYRSLYDARPSDIKITGAYFSRYDYLFVNATNVYSEGEKTEKDFYYIFYITSEKVPNGPFQYRTETRYERKEFHQGKYTPISDMLGIVENQKENGSGYKDVRLNRDPYPETADRARYSLKASMKSVNAKLFLISLGYNGHTMAFLVDGDGHICSKKIYDTTSDCLYVDISGEEACLSDYELRFIRRALLLPNIFPGCGPIHFRHDTEGERQRKLVLSTGDGLLEN